MNNTTPTCANCGRPCPKDAIVCPVTGNPEEPLRAITLCAQCYSSLGSCGSCANATPCAWDYYNGPIPKQVQVTKRQGNMIMQTIAPNPNLIKELCELCPCCDLSEEQPVCYRKNFNLCPSYKEVDLSGLLK